MFRGLGLMGALLTTSALVAQEPGMLPGARPPGLLPGALSAKPEKPPVLGSTPVPTAKDLETERRYIAGVVDPQNTLDLIAGRTRVIILKAAPTRTHVADTTVATFRILEPDAKQMIVGGAQPGITVMTFWFADPEDKDKEVILSYLVRVFPDPVAKARHAAALKALEAEVNGAFPNSRARLNLVGDKVLLSGQAHDNRDAALIPKVIK
jgi:Flp pilus assembly secretin CpaC